MPREFDTRPRSSSPALRSGEAGLDVGANGTVYTAWAEPVTLAAVGMQPCEEGGCV